MDRLWSPWRFSYLAGDTAQEKPKPASCVFCDLLADPRSDEEKLIFHRGVENFLVLNLFPYTSGHSMVVSYKHYPDLDRAPEAVTAEMMNLTRQCQTALRQAYKPDGFNIGLNQGTAAGAGVAGHMHMHLVPRWVGDANFVSTIGETRVLPETLNDTWRKMQRAFSDVNS